MTGADDPRGRPHGEDALPPPPDGWWEDGPTQGTRERFMAGEPVGGGVRAPILASWERCRGMGLPPDRLQFVHTQDQDQESARRLVDTARPVLTRLETVLSDTATIVVLTDGGARFLLRTTVEPPLDRRLDAAIEPGVSFAERHVGTNGVGTALATGRPSLVRGSEHFVERLTPFTCAAALVHDPLSGQVEGVLALTCRADDARPTMTATVREAAAAVERCLLEQTSERERVLLRDYLGALRDSAPTVPLLSGATGAAHAVLEEIGPGDRRLLMERAAELISSPRPGRAAVRVRLTSGRPAVLMRRPLRSPSGVVGAVVEASFPLGLARVPMLPAAPLLRTSGPDPPGPSGIPDPPGRPENRETTGPTGQTRPAPARPAGGSPTHPGPAADGTADDGRTEPGGPEPRTEGPGGGPGEFLLVGEHGVGGLALAARRRLELLCTAGGQIGTTLDIQRTAEELAEVSVRTGFADFVAVDLADCVLGGDEPGDHGSRTTRRVALRGIGPPPPFFPPGDEIKYLPVTPHARCCTTNTSLLIPDLNDAPGWRAQDPVRCQAVLDAGVHCLIIAPLRARGVTLGTAAFYRSRRPDPFEEDDRLLAGELAGRAAVCVDNARRYTREHTLALALQRSLLPRGLPEQHAVEVAHRYLPAETGVGGDWYDVLPLSGARVALVVGDVVGHGLHAAATMGRLRTAVHNFSALDLGPEDVLAHLDDLVNQLDPDETGGDEGGYAGGVVGATCLYVVYDPASRRCTMARAGHPLPVLVHPGGGAEFVDVPPGPPLGLGTMPFEAVEVEVAESSELVLYTDGLIEEYGGIAGGAEALRQLVAEGTRAPEELCEALVRAMVGGRPARPGDDVALLVARTRTLGRDQLAHWHVPDDPAAVSRVRSEATRRLAAWGLEELAFTTELVISELVTNALRHAVGPIGVRLLRDRALICEVEDGSCSAPRLRRARSMDEDGRGLFLVARLTQNWGTRFTTDGKVIWTEQALPPA